MRIDVSLEHRPLEAELAALHARMRRPGDVLHALPALATAPPGFAFRYRESHGEFYVYVEDASRNVLAGCTVFNRVWGMDRRIGRYLRSPHSRYGAAYRRQGLATAVYRWALDAGLCLVSGPRQSPGAYRLWMALARSYELAWADTSQKKLRIVQERLDPGQFDALDTRMLLLGAGWTLERLAKPACGDFRTSCLSGSFAGFRLAAGATST
jgi:hypothetical protein